MDPRISIIVPVYNIAGYVTRCIDSIVTQRYSNIQILVVNDGSSENSLEIIEKKYAANNRIKIINKPNGGLSSARNTGLRLATGDYILFVDGDDWIEENTLEILVETLRKNGGADIVEFGYATTNGHDMLKTIRFAESKIIGAKNILSEFFYGTLITDIACNKLFAKKLFDGLQFDEGEIHEDCRIMPKILSKSKEIIIIESVLYFYFQRADSITGERFNDKTLERIKACEHVVEYCSQGEKVLEKFEDAARIRLCFACIYTYDRWLESERTAYCREKIMSKFLQNYMKIEASVAFRSLPPHKRFFLVLFKHNQRIAITVYRFFRG